MLGVISVLMPIMRSYYLLKARKAVVKAIRNKMKEKQNEVERSQDKQRSYELDFWTDKNCAVAQLIVIHKNSERKEAQPVVIQVSGSLHLDDPLMLHLNPMLLDSHLNLLYNKDSKTVASLTREIKNKLHKVSGCLSGLYLFDNPIYFCYKVLNLLILIEDLNQSTFKSVGLKANIVILEQLKVKYQRLKYRYNQLYQVKSKSFDKIEAFRKKLIEFDSLKDKFTYQFLIFLTPTFQNKKLTLLNSEIEELTSKHPM